MKSATKGPTSKPRHGFTADGDAVHAKTADHMNTETTYARVGKWLAVKITTGVGSMTCAYAFGLIALVSLPAILSQAGWIAFPKWMVAPGLILIVAWIAQTFLQLVLLSIIIVGQNISATASDARAAKTFEDTENIQNVLDLEIEGGLTTVMEAIKALSAQIAAINAEK